MRSAVIAALSASLLSILTCCATPETPEQLAARQAQQQQWPAQHQENNNQLRQQITAKEAAQCQSYGAQPGTDGYVNCMVSLENERVREIDTFNAQQQTNVEANRPRFCNTDTAGLSFCY